MDTQVRRSTVWSWGERAGAILGVISIVVLVWAAFRYGAGHDAAFFALVIALVLGVTALGVHVAAREARYRRRARSEER
ncbi:hypothetical protein BWL13_01286 [Microbacterium oleivorans]|uniref:hypothetical protein n=1 Tax=Microbacterium oleivorans TaxID=273677 RepID=UPI0009766B88|nr:hypothetical protein [Microbacterium oleivorans]AZS43720.1 hypothetical protein BWL13_01286 [Microbacterium oleivorans]